MNEKRAKRLEGRYSKMEDAILRAYGKNPKAYIMGFYQRKARIENEPMAYGAILVLVLGFLWEIASKLILTAFDFSQFGEAAVAMELLVRGGTAIGIVGLLAILGALFYSNRKSREATMIEEYILDKHGFLGKGTRG